MNVEPNSSLPIHIARAYGLQQPRPTVPVEQAREAVEAQRTEIRKELTNSQRNIARLIAGVVPGGIDFDAFTSDRVQVDDPNEKALVLKLMQFGPTVASVADSLEPHRLCNYLYELASTFHKFFEHCPVLRSDVPDDVRQGRLALCKLVALTLRRGLDLLGIDVVERM